VKILSIQPRKGGQTLMVTIPKEIVEALDLKGGEKVKVLLDREADKITYQILRKQRTRTGG